MMPYERFDAWRLCHELALEIYRVTERFPKRELYGLTSQARRAAFSAAANIVEGSARHGRREFRRFLDIARASLVELSYVIRFAADLGVLAEADAARLHAMRDRAAIVTWKLYASMRAGRRGPAAPAPSAEPTASAASAAPAAPAAISTSPRTARRSAGTRPASSRSP